MPRYAIIIPACNEAACIEAVIRELQGVLDRERFVIAVGVNGSTDRTGRIARVLGLAGLAGEAPGVVVAETERRGYGHGCRAAIDLLERAEAGIAAFIFVAGDGANDPRDIAKLVAEFERGEAKMVLGCRTRSPRNWSVMNAHYVVANWLFGAWCGVLTGRFFADLGPLRLIERELLFAMELREWTFGWTIEAQVRAARLGARVVELSVRERRRLAGVQKVSHVSWRRTLSVGAHIVAAGWRARWRASG